MRETTRQTNAREAREIEAARRTSLAKGEVGIREKKPVPTLAEFANGDFLQFARSRFKKKLKTLLYYQNGVKNLLSFSQLADQRLDSITAQMIQKYTSARQVRGLQISSINRELQVLRRMFSLAWEWGKVEKALPKVKMIPGEKHRERVLTPKEEDMYLGAAMSNIMKRYRDPHLMRDVGTVLLDCGMRPEECFRMRAENIRDGNIEILFGKTNNSRRRIPMTSRVEAIVQMRLSKAAGNGWVFPAKTKSGHIEPSSIRKQHATVCREGGVESFELYTLRHTCLSRWAPHMDPWTLAYLAGHSDMSTTKRYIHPQKDVTRGAIERARQSIELARGGYELRHTSQRAPESLVEDTEVY